MVEISTLGNRVFRYLLSRGGGGGGAARRVFTKSRRSFFKHSRQHDNCMFEKRVENDSNEAKANVFIF